MCREYSGQRKSSPKIPKERAEQMEKSTVECTKRNKGYSSRRILLVSQVMNHLLTA